MWRPGNKLVHPFNPELGVGVILRVEGRFLHVLFPEVDRELTLSARDGGFSRLTMRPGDEAVLVESGDVVHIAAVRGEDEYELADGRVVADAAVWPRRSPDTPLERLAALDLDSADALQNRLDGLRLRSLREAGGLGSMLGGRIELYPHQLHTALQAVRHDPVRWLLADEVGLGKTIEACLVLSALVRTGRAERALVLAPGTLTVQWLGELYRKFHQVFDLLDPERIEAVRSTCGEDVNPFDAHPFAVLGLEEFATNAELQAAVAGADLDLVVVDEAHRLARSPARAAFSQLVTRARHALLLTATPLRADREGFFMLQRLLHPDAYPDLDGFLAAVSAGEAVVPCASAVRREDVGGLPPRVPVPVDIGPPTRDLGEDPRVRWLAAQVRRWSEQGDKALVFCRSADTVDALKRHLESATATRAAVFHERIPERTRDIEVAAFRASLAPVLLCSEAGSEGRNFQFCDRMVHFDLPLDPVLLEQRIGRLDRIGRRLPVEIVYLRHPAAAPDLARLYERLGLFSTPSAGLDSALADLAGQLRAAVRGSAPFDEEAAVAAVLTARDRADVDLPRACYPDAYDASQAEAVLSLVPEDLGPATQRFSVGAMKALGIEVVEKGGRARHYVEIGAGSRVDDLPGVPGDSRWLGTFDRQEAVECEELEFFASGHALVEGLLLELEDGRRGRAALFEVDGPGLEGGGLLGVYSTGPEWSLQILDGQAQPRPDWEEPLLAGLPEARDVDPEKIGEPRAFGEGVRALGESLSGTGELVAVACFRWAR